MAGASVDRCASLLAWGDAAGCVRVATQVCHFFFAPGVYRVFYLRVLEVYSVIYDSGSVARRAIFSPRETSPESIIASLRCCRITRSSVDRCASLLAWGDAAGSVRVVTQVCLCILEYLVICDSG